MTQDPSGHREPTLEMLPEILDAADLAAYLDMPLSTVRSLAQQGRIPSIKIGRRRKFRRDAIRHWLDSLGAETAASVPGAPADTPRLHIPRPAPGAARSNAANTRTKS